MEQKFKNLSHLDNQLSYFDLIDLMSHNANGLFRSCKRSTGNSVHAQMRVRAFG